MFPSQDDQFGLGDIPNGGEAGGPPPADAMFESFLNDELDGVDAPASGEARENEVLSTGLEFIAGMKSMR